MNEYRMIERLMGCAFELIVSAKDASEANQLLDEGVTEIKRIEDLLSEFKEGTVTSQINMNAGVKSVVVNEEVMAIIKRCIKISEITRGAFDITVGPLKKIYRFKNNAFNFPEKNSVKEALDLVGYHKIEVNELKNEIFLSGKNMSISFAAIGKGYAADRVRKIWLSRGVNSGVISASGDLTTIGMRPDGSPWKVGIADPDNRDKVLYYIPVTNASVATSGDAEQYFMYRGIQYSHNINPITGQPVTGIKSVSVISKTAELSDALATAVYIMGIDVGVHFIDQLPDTHCIIIDDKNQSFTSAKIEIQYEA